MNLTITQIILLLQIFGGQVTISTQQEDEDLKILISRDLTHLELNNEQLYDIKVSEKGYEMVRTILKSTNQ